VFGDDVVAAAMIDRLVHHADVVALKGDSYRLKNRDLGRTPRPSTNKPRLVNLRLPTTDQFSVAVDSYDISVVGDGATLVARIIERMNRRLEVLPSQEGDDLVTPQACSGRSSALDQTNRRVGRNGLAQARSAASDSGSA
jgi:hypothetical protein